MTNPTEAEKLVGQLRGQADNQDGEYDAIIDTDILRQAATMLEAQAAEIARLREALDQIAGKGNDETIFRGLELRTIARAALATPEGEG